MIKSGEKKGFMQTPNYNYDKKRFEPFIDAVVAIILIILVFELRVPAFCNLINNAKQPRYYSIL